MGVGAEQGAAELEQLGSAPSSFLTSGFYFNHDLAVYRQAALSGSVPGGKKPGRPSPPPEAGEAAGGRREQGGADSAVEATVQKSRAAAEESAAPEPHDAVEETVGPIREFEAAELSVLLKYAGLEPVIEAGSDGVYQIAGQVYDEPRAPVDADTAGLVESVVSEEESDEKAAVGGSGIDALFGGDDLDLFGDLSGDESAVHRSVFDTVEPGVIEDFPVTERGVDYDRILGRFRRSESGIYRSLVAVTRAWNAKSGVIFVEEGDSYLPRFSIGLVEDCRAKLEIGKRSELHRQIIKPRRILLIKQPLDEISYFNRECDTSQLGFLRRSMLLPIVFRDSDAYLLIGVAESTETIAEAIQPIAGR